MKALNFDRSVLKSEITVLIMSQEKEANFQLTHAKWYYLYSRATHTKFF